MKQLYVVLYWLWKVLPIPRWGQWIILWFANTKVLQTLRNEGSIPKDIGWDLSAATIWRPRATQNMVFRLSGAALQPGKGFRDLFENTNRHSRYVSILANVVLSY